MAITLSTPTEMMGFTMEGRKDHESKPQTCGPKLDSKALTAIHDTEALLGTPTSEWRKTTLMGGAPRVRFDEARGMWCAWLDEEGADPTYERAKIRGEWTTRLGAFRRLRNAVPRTSAQDHSTSSAPPVQRPEPGGGSTSMLDALAARRQHVKPRGVSGTLKHYLGLAAYVLASVVVTLCIVLGLWEGFIRGMVSPPRATIAPVVAVRPAVVTPVVEDLPEAPAAPVPRRRR